MSKYIYDVVLDLKGQIAMSADELTRQIYVLMQPTRQKIIKTLREAKSAGKTLYIKEIADRVGEPERNVSFHLATLAENGFVKGEYREISAPTHHSQMTGRAAKY